MLLGGEDQLTIKNEVDFVRKDKHFRGKYQDHLRLAQRKKNTI